MKKVTHHEIQISNYEREQEITLPNGAEFLSMIPGPKQSILNFRVDWNIGGKTKRKVKSIRKDEDVELNWKYLGYHFIDPSGPISSFYLI